MTSLSRVERYLEWNWFLRHVLVPIAALTFYCFSYAFFSAWLLPIGANSIFTYMLGRYLLLFLLLACLIPLFLFVSGRKGGVTLNRSAPGIQPGHLTFLLLPLTPVIQYIINNRSILSVADSFLVLIFFTILFGIFIVGLPAWLGSIASAHILMVTGLAFMVTITNMALLSQEFNWFQEGDLRIQIGYFGVALAISWLLSAMKNKKIVLMLLLGYLVINSSMQLLSKVSDASAKSLPNGEAELQLMAESRRPAITPNIYLLVYDSYVTNETMLSYGIDNHSQEEYLSQQGFVLYPHTYSIAPASLASMSRVLNASNEFYGPERKGVSGDGRVQNTLKELGYDTYGIFPSDYMFWGPGSSYDVSIPDQVMVPPYQLLASAIIIGEFRFDLGFKSQTHEQYVERKQDVLKGALHAPVFLYSHSDLPVHSQNSGACLPDEVELFAQRLSKANAEMRQDIETITRNDPHSIIIIAGDHGPYLTKNCTLTSTSYDISEISRLDIQDRYGTFLAIRWPSAEYARYDDITVLQDLFPSIFAYLYDDPAFLKLKAKPELVDTETISGASVINGVIHGGVNDGEPLFLSPQ